jgi:hypothetical protein
MHNSSNARGPSRSLRRFSNRDTVPIWQARLSAALVQGITAKRGFEISSSTRGNLICTSEFELPGEILVLIETSPSRMYWRAIDVKIVVDPHRPRTLDERPGCVLPMSCTEGWEQGQVTALSTIHVGSSVPLGISYLYVNPRFPKRCQHVCGL